MARLLFLVTAALLALGGSARAADPQILGVIAGNDAVPLDCRFGACSIELSTFCLEQRAAVPARGTEYRIAGGAAAPVTLVATDRSGATVRLPAADLATLTAARGNRAVRLALSYAALAPRGLTAPRLEIGAGVSLVPGGLAERAAEPAVAARIALAAGPLREVATALVDSAGPPAAAARLLNRLINAVPDDRDGDVLDRRALWDRALPDGAAGDRAGAPLARRAFDRCAKLPGGGFISFRQCLASHHDMLLGPLNRAYWKAVGTGI